MSGGLPQTMQAMGTASKLIRFFIFILVGVIIWKLRYYVIPSQSFKSSLPPVISLQNVDNTGIKAIPHQTEKMVGLPMENLDAIQPPPLRVAVYYEALCSDSRDYIIRQLVPAYKAMRDVITLDFVPFGKATSQVLPNGRKTFQCQHGPKECQANIVHACVAKHIKDEEKRLQIVKCMIDINFRESPIQAGKKCLAKFEEDSSTVERCSFGEEGEELHFHMGKRTDSLDPKVKFIPTITINESQKNQQLILKDLILALCTVYSGPKHSACDS